MVGGSRIAAIGAAGEGPIAADSNDTNAAPVPPLVLDSHWDDEPGPDDAEPAASGASRAWLMPALAGLGIAGWTGIFAAAHGPAMANGASLAQWSDWIASWSGPVLLICVGWLLFMRSSRRETGRFADAARLLGQESAQLETRLSVVNRELSLAREFLASQSRDLDTLGRLAVERLSQHGDRLATLVQDNSAQVEAIGSVSTAALENMERLRGQLPVIASSAKDVTNNIANSGRVAHAHLQSLVSGLGRLNEFGQASERHVATMREQIDEALGMAEARTHQLDAELTAQLAEMAHRSERVRQEIEAQEAASLATMRERAEALSQDLSATRARLDEDEAESLISLRARLSALRDEGAAMARALRDSEATAVANWQGTIARIATELGALDGEITARHARITDTTGALGAATQAATDRFAAISTQLDHISGAEGGLADLLAARLDSLTRSLGDTESHIDRLSDSSVRLLELIQSSAQHSRDQLPRAIAVGEERLTSFETRVMALRDAVKDANARGEALHYQAIAARDTITSATTDLSALHEGLDDKTRAHAQVLEQLHLSLGQMEADTLRLAVQAQGELVTAIEQLRGAAMNAVHDIETKSAGSITALAEKLGSESGAAIERAMRLQTAEIAGQLEQSAAHAAGVSREAAVQFRDQLAKVDELVGNLERRVAQARQRAEEQVDNDFARRVALITESLNSAAIDIARVFDTDITDTAWAAYLRGDRGIFTRRAVRLLDTSEVKAIMRIYEDDRSFAEHVNHYIHDFEAMLRQLLSTRDGHALGVTVLSSDMGKLYVALAQAIERLRN